MRSGPTADQRVRAGLLIVVALISWLHSPAIDGLQQTPEFQLTADALLPGAFQGRVLAFGLDTGTTRSFVDVRLAAAAGAKLLTTIPVSGVGPAMHRAGILSKSLAIQFPFDGGSITHEIDGVEDYSRMSALEGRDLDGILGADFFERFVVEIDYLNERVRLHPKKFKPPEDAIALPLDFSRSRLPLVNMRIQLADGKVIKTRAMIDTGARGYLLSTEEFSKRHRLRDALGGIDVPLGEGIGGKVTGRLARLPILELGTFRMSQSVLGLLGGGTRGLTGERMYDLNVGSDVLRRFSVFFDYGRRKMTLIPNERLDDVFEAPMSGLQLASLGSPHDRVVVEGVYPNSPAAEAGFAPGDEIIEVNGERLAALAVIDMRSRLRQPEGTEIKITTRRQNMRGVLTLVLRRLVEP